MNLFLRTKLTSVRGLTISVLLLAVGGRAQGQPKEQVKDPPKPAAIAPDQFATLHRLIKPQAGELRFHEIPWLIDVWEARKKAAAEGKPILVWSGAGGAPIGVC